MKRSFLKFLVLFSFIFLPFFAQDAFACRCAAKPTPYQAFEEAKAVFVGKIIRAKKLSDGYNPEMQLHFLVQESFKGINDTEINVKASRGVNGSCVGTFAAGRTYLVYAYEQETTKGYLVTGMCTRTMNIESAQDDIFYIRASLEGKPEPRIYGSVDLLDTDLTKYTLRFTYVEGIKIFVEGENGRFETVTDKNGLFSFDKIPDGKYKVRPELSAKYMSYWRDAKEIILDSQNIIPRREYDLYQRDGRSAYLEFMVGWNNKISGKVLDEEGKPIKRALVKLLPVNFANDKIFTPSDDSSEFIRATNSSLDESKYTTSGHTPGRYVLAVEVWAPFVSGAQNLRTYYPQAADSEKAGIIELGESDKRNIDIKLRPDLIARDIEGELFWSDGTRVKDGWVSLEKLRNRDHKDNLEYDDEESTEEGKFKIQAFENAQYWLHAGGEVYGRGLKARPLKITVGKTNAPLRIIIPLPKNLSAKQ